MNQPGCFPNGWIGVCESQYLKDNEIKRFDFCGHRIILLRSSSSSSSSGLSLGKPYALDAFCPHLGADFSVGGKIVKKCETDCIRCPFHGWVFRANDGLCLEVPYAKDKSKSIYWTIVLIESTDNNLFIRTTKWSKSESLEMPGNEWIHLCLASFRR